MKLNLRLFTGVALLLANASPARAQDSATLAPRPAQPVFSMGQPSLWKRYGSALGTWSGGGAGTAANILIGLHHPITNPVTGALGASAEGYGALGGAYSGIGARLLATSRFFGISVGADWNVSHGRLDFLLSWEAAIRRGGLLGHGTMLRVDWLPTRARTLGIGMNVPLMQPFAGRTRQRYTDVELPSGSGAPTLGTSPSPPLPASAETALEAVDRAATRIRAYTNLYLAADERILLGDDAAAGSGPTSAQPGSDYAAVIRAYDDGLARAFGVAAGDAAAGEAIARHARAVAFDQIIVPYDSLFGQTKEEQGIRSLVARAQERFARWVRDSSGVAPGPAAGVLQVHARWIGIIARVQHDLRSEWKDTRLVWLPFQLALTPEQYDEQPEVDSLIARVVGQPFSDRNALTYLRATDLPLEIARQIYAARDYHVLWIHDFAGQRPSGAVDNIGYEMVADVYLPALTAAVQRYDSTGHLPVYMILLDEYFYEPRAGRLWMNILEDPLHASMALPGHDAAREAHLRGRQAALRAAVAASRRLQREAERAGGDAWLRRVVKVNVNITQPADFSFRSSHILPPIPGVPDNLMRDHRKISFYDLNEAQPYRGSLILMGVGIGEHYASATWEDRGYRLRGPAALEARAALRRELLLNGFRERDIPEPLRTITGAPSDTATARSMNLGEYVGRALQVHNDVGFGQKNSSVARALLYTLTMPGSAIIVPDPLWLSENWAGMLAAAAARGSRVFVIAPAVANAPSPQAPLMAREHDVMLRLLELRHSLDTRLRQNGGELRVGIFAAKAPINDAQGRVREIRAGLARNPWIRQVVPFDSQTVAVLDSAFTRTAADDEDATSLAHDERPRAPQLHQKTQLFAGPGALTALARVPGWDRVLATTMRAQSRETANFAEQLGWTTPDVDTLATRSTDVRLRSYEAAVPESERRRVSLYFSMGTQNQDPRGLLSDAETTLLVSGFNAAAGLADLYFIMARSDWISSQQGLEQYVPKPSSLMRRLAQLIRLTL